MNREFVIHARDIVNLCLVYIPALVGWAAILYVLTHWPKGKKP